MAVIDESKYIKLTEILKITKKTINVKTFKNIFPNIELIYMSKCYCFKFQGNRVENIERICNRISEIYYEKELRNPYERIDYFLNKYENEYHEKYPLLFSSFKEYAYAKITESTRNEQNLLKLSKMLISSFDFLITHIECDINSLNEKNIENIILDKKIKITYAKTISYYFSYLKNNEIVSFSSIVKVKNYVVLKKDTDFYSIEEWNKFVSLALNVDKHIIKAMNNVVYARYWLYLLLHLCIAWRKSDILSIPALDNLVGIEKYNLSWFESSSFTIKDAVYIINNTQLQAEQYVTQKTKAIKHFSIPTAFYIPVAIAIIIVENWRRNINCKNIFGKTDPSSGKVLADYLGNEIENFSSIKANRSLLTFVDKIASEVGADNYIRISSYMRSHKTNYYSMSDTTSVYLHSTYSDKELNEVTLQLYDRGTFGWLYDSMIKIVNEDVRLSTNDKTNIIAHLQQVLPIEKVEQLAECIYQQNLKKEVVINELLQLPTEKLKETIVKLGDGKLISKQDDIYCIKENGCHYLTRTDCLSCEYSIPTIHTLLSVTTEINNIFESLSTEISPYKYDRLRITDKMFKLYSVIQEVADTFGEEYVNSFIDYVELKNKLISSYTKLKELEEKSE